MIRKINTWKSACVFLCFKSTSNTLIFVYVSDLPRDLLLENRVKTYYVYDAMNNAARIFVSNLIINFLLH